MTISWPLFVMHYECAKNLLKFIKRDGAFPHLLHFYVIGLISYINYANKWLQREGTFPHFSLLRCHRTCIIYKLCKSVVTTWRVFLQETEQKKLLAFFSLSLLVNHLIAINQRYHDKLSGPNTMSYTSWTLPSCPTMSNTAFLHDLSGMTKTLNTQFKKQLKVVK